MNPAAVTAPPSKSLSHRALIAAALARGQSLLDNLLESDDINRTQDLLRLVGAGIRRLAPGSYHVTGLGGAPQGPANGQTAQTGSADRRQTGPAAQGQTEPLDCFVGESGTSCRLLTAVLAAGQGLFRMHGAGRMHERPIRELTDALQQLGASVDFEGKAGCPPLLLHARGLSTPDGQWLPVSCDESSQYLSGLLLAAPLARDGLRLALGGAKAVSWPYVGLTLQTLEDFGLTFRVQTRDAGGNWSDADWRALRTVVPGALRLDVPRGCYRPFNGRVEGDYSGASYLLAAGALGADPFPRAVAVTGLRQESLQGDAAIVDILARMGAQVAWQGDTVTVAPPSDGTLRGLDLDMGFCPDLVPTVAVLAARARGETRIRGVAHLRLKESDRLAAPANELAKTGCAVSITDDGLHITPATANTAHGGRFALSCHGDHRMAMSLALLELDGNTTITLDDPACVAKSFPAFWQTWKQLCPRGTAGGPL